MQTIDRKGLFSNDTIEVWSQQEVDHLETLCHVTRYRVLTHLWGYHRMASYTGLGTLFRLCRKIVLVMKSNLL